MNFTQLLFVFLYTLNLFPFTQNNNPIIISIPKCGSHLVAKCIEMLGFKPSIQHWAHNALLDEELSQKK